MPNRYVDYELKVTNTLNADNKRFIFSIPVKGGFVAHFKKFRVIAQEGVDSIRFFIIMANEPEAMQHHTNALKGEPVETGLCVSPAISMWRNGNMMVGYASAGKVEIEMFKKICGEYSTCEVVYRGEDAYVLGFQASERHNFDNTKSNCTSVDLETTKPIDEMADETPKTVDIPDGFSGELDINKLIEGIKERRESLGEEQYKTIKRREEFLQKIHEAKKKEKETREIDPKDKALETFRKIMKEQIHSVIDSMCDASDDVLFQVYHGIVCGALDCYKDMLKRAIKEDE